MLTSLTQKRIPAAQSGQTTAGRQAAQPGAGAPNSAMTSLWEQSAPGYATPGLAEQMQARLAGQKGEPPDMPNRRGSAFLPGSFFLSARGPPPSKVSKTAETPSILRVFPAYLSTS